MLGIDSLDRHSDIGLAHTLTEVLEGTMYHEADGRIRRGLLTIGSGPGLQLATISLAGDDGEDHAVGEVDAILRTPLVTHVLAGWIGVDVHGLYSMRYLSLSIP